MIEYMSVTTVASGENTMIELSQEDLARVAGGTKVDLSLKKDPKGDVTVGAGVRFDNGWGVGVTAGTDGSVGGTVTISF